MGPFLPGENTMGFDLALFLDSLKHMVSNCACHADILAYIKSMEQYAKECGKL